LQIKQRADGSEQSTSEMRCLKIIQRNIRRVCAKPGSNYPLPPTNIRFTPSDAEASRIILCPAGAPALHLSQSHCPSLTVPEPRIRRSTGWWRRILAQFMVI
jgi:hypothetical protein